MIDFDWKKYSFYNWELKTRHSFSLSLLGDGSSNILPCNRDVSYIFHGERKTSYIPFILGRWCKEILALIYFFLG